MRQKPAAAMQKTYDDCYLVCSTAVYFESQANEAEALRSWRNALDQIYYFNAYRRPANWAPKTETEKALQASLRELELQCKERVDLLEALKQSRKDAKKEKASADDDDPKPPSDPTPRPDIHPDGAGWLGDGTVPPVSYPDLARPPLPKPVADPAIQEVDAQHKPGKEGRHAEDPEAYAEGGQEGVIVVASVRIEGKAPCGCQGRDPGMGFHFGSK
ncbi:AAA family ATPAse [Neofusicoccum parvum]|uniref:Putative aaa family protein n=1 Tax=Botryosphaeria parva (strain UCR-NP2) TaxID=1287680 RepID=R1GQ79_BOTPV|nr:putative aaa family protein [Neofusicoccum parvum UCRNP2]GME35344.1 AAA family ATPAse [Neofusicoccum parvum]